MQNDDYLPGLWVLSQIVDNNLKEKTTMRNTTICTIL